MAKQKNTKRALLMSALSLLMCVSMLIGSTFAWFTDSVTSGVNKIVAGNLDIGVYYAYPSDVVDGDIPADAWKPVTADKSIFNEDALWEPGYTEAVFIKFVNEGSLALQYQLQVDILKEVIGKNKEGKDIQLSNYINAYACNCFQWDYTSYLFTNRDSATNPAGAPNPYFDTLYNAANGDVATPSGDNPLSLDSWQWLDPTETTYATLVLWMPTTVTNDANHDGENVPAIDLGISVVATQYTWEKDSFGDDYDKDSQLPIVANDAESLIAALAVGGKVKLENDVVISADLLTNDASVASIPVGMYISEDTVLDLNGHDIIIADNDAGTTVAIFAKDADLIITGNGTIKQEGHDDYLLWAKGNSTVTIKDGIFETGSGDSSVLYASGNTAYDPTDDYATINIYGGTFISGNPSDAQDNANVMNHGVGRINYYGGTFNWDPGALKGDDAPYIKVAEGYHVVQDGSDYVVVPDSIDAVVSDAASLQAALNNAEGDYIIELAGDIVGDVTVTQKFDVKITIDGKNHTYKGSIIIDGKSATILSAGLTVKNVNFDASAITTDACINMGDENNSNNTRYVANLTVEDCTFTGTYPSVEQVGIKTYTGGGQNLTVKRCTATKMHSLAQIHNIVNVEFVDCDVVDCKNGISVGSSRNAKIINCDIGAAAYGVRCDGGETNSALVIADCNITANIPVVIRKVSKGYALTVNGTNTITATNTEGLWCVAATNEYGDVNQAGLTAVGAEVTITVNDAALDTNGVFIKK